MSPKKAQRSLFLVLLLCLTLTLTACFAVDNQLNESNSFVVTDSLGREVAVPNNLQRIAALDSFAGQAVIMFGAGDLMKATVGGVQRDLLLQAMCPSLVNASVAMSSSVVNMEELLRLQTELLFIKGDVYRNEQEKEKIEQSGIPFVVIDYNSIDSQMQAFTIIGQTLGQEEEANLFKQYFTECLQKAEKIVASIPTAAKPALYHAVNEAVRTDIKDSLAAQWIAVTGAKNVSVNEQLNALDNNYYATLEQIFLWNPDLIICNETGVADYILSDSKWSGLRAVENQQVYQMPIGVSRWGHPGGTETPLAVLWLTKLLYPKEAVAIDLTQEMKYFYHTFYDYELTDQETAAILAGEGIRTPSTGSVVNN